ncbi:14056_t:CDS:2, partial [Cetraspora pellucida]
ENFIMTAPQNPITRAIWDGTLPIKFSLDSTEAAALGAKAIVEPYFIEAPRCSYFPLWTSQIRKYFVDMALNFIGDDADIWYDVDGTPLKWHYPIGLLYDLHTGYRPDSNSPPPLPWPVTVHFKNFPTDKLIRAQAIDATQDFFMSMIKEEWEHKEENYDRFWSVNYRLVINDGQIPKHIPIRIYLPDNCPVIQEPISPVDEN